MERVLLFPFEDGELANARKIGQKKWYSIALTYTCVSVDLSISKCGEGKNKKGQDVFHVWQHLTSGLSRLTSH